MHSETHQSIQNKEVMVQFGDGDCQHPENLPRLQSSSQLRETQTLKGLGRALRNVLEPCINDLENVQRLLQQEIRARLLCSCQIHRTHRAEGLRDAGETGEVLPSLATAGVEEAGRAVQN